MDQLLYRKDFIDTYENIPNALSIGSNLTLNVETKTAMLDGKIAAGKVVHTPNWVRIPPGKSKLEIFWSDWAKRPEIEILFEERSL